ncbi:rhogap domain containing protein, partial [Entamoeba invadens IP1]
KQKYKIDVTQCTLQRTSDLFEPELSGKQQSLPQLLLRQKSKPYDNQFLQINSGKDAFVFFIPDKTQFINFLTLLGLNMKIVGTYGYPLRVSVLKSAWRFPNPIFRSIQYLRYNRSYENKGLFRLSGEQVENKRVKSVFDSDTTAESVEFKDMNIAGCVLKDYLRSLDERIFPMRFNQRLLDAAKDEKTVFVDKVKTIVSEIPSINQSCLWYIFDFLNLVLKYKELNLMNEENLAIVFVPNMFDFDMSNMFMNNSELTLYKTIFIKILDNYEEIFENVKKENERI